MPRPTSTIFRRRLNCEVTPSERNDLNLLQHSMEAGCVSEALRRAAKLALDVIPIHPNGHRLFLVQAMEGEEECEISLAPVNPGDVKHLRERLNLDLPISTLGDFDQIAQRLDLRSRIAVIRWLIQFGGSFYRAGLPRPTILVIRTAGEKDKHLQFISA